MATAKPKTEIVVTDRGGIEIGGTRYEPGDTVPAVGRRDRWLFDQGYCVEREIEETA